ncbi:putative corticotropin releasing hormone binding protein [Operophtera brumata]|uniref:Putative corticotropin releasing hormone binding protein n=1 Tax=Operophtera brumata TaxID=104452 RepID=A0A0L7L872_OPEBR|nr:putative corticotropin releasing hormone binding protein [Operophtera brumata]
MYAKSMQIIPREIKQVPPQLTSFTFAVYFSKNFDGEIVGTLSQRRRECAVPSYKASHIKARGKLPIHKLFDADVTERRFLSNFPTQLAKNKHNNVLPTKMGTQRPPAGSIETFTPVTPLKHISWLARLCDMHVRSRNCFLVTSEEGELFYKSPSDEPVVCGIYMIAEPDKRIEVIFNYIDVPCENGGLVAREFYSQDNLICYAIKSYYLYLILHAPGCGEGRLMTVVILDFAPVSVASSEI